MRLLKFAQLKEKGHPYTREHTAHLVAEGRFPAPIVLSRDASGTPTSIAWVEAEIDAHYAGLIAERDRRLASQLVAQPDADPKAPHESGVAAMEATARNARREAGKKGAEVKWARWRAKREAATEAG